MKTTLRSQLSTGYACIVLAVIAVISILANVLVNQQFEAYVMAQQDQFAASLAEGLAGQYNAQTDSWNVDYIHGVGMYALEDGYIIKVYDAHGASVWDAENHDMETCHMVMERISTTMAQRRPDLHGDFVTRQFALARNGAVVGQLDVSYYSPYYLDENAFRFIDALNVILVAVAIGALALSVVSGLLLARRLTAPLAKASAAARAIAAGDYRMRVDEHQKTVELAELTRSVNNLAESLEAQEALRKQLITDVAHELKTPLAIATAHLEAINEGVWEPTPERLQGCCDELRRIDALVGDMQKLNETESAYLNLDCEDVDLLQLAGEVADRCAPQMSERNLTCQVAGENAVASADRRRLYQVLANLVSNAVKYSEAGTQISIEVRTGDDEASVSVTDHGEGIAPEDVPYVFERFFRTDRSRSRKTGGTGIGLAIVKSLVQAHGGTVDVRSTVGEGSCFTVHLPRA